MQHDFLVYVVCLAAAALAAVATATHGTRITPCPPPDTKPDACTFARQRNGGFGPAFVYVNSGSEYISAMRDFCTCMQPRPAAEASDSGVPRAHMESLADETALVYSSTRRNTTSRMSLFKGAPRRGLDVVRYRLLRGPQNVLLDLYQTPWSLEFRTEAHESILKVGWLRPPASDVAAAGLNGGINNRTNSSNPTTRAATIVDFESSAGGARLSVVFLGTHHQKRRRGKRKREMTMTMMTGIHVERYNYTLTHFVERPAPPATAATAAAVAVVAGGELALFIHNNSEIVATGVLRHDGRLRHMYIVNRLTATAAQVGRFNALVKWFPEYF